MTRDLNRHRLQITPPPVPVDHGTPKGRFSGTIDHVDIDVAPEAYHDPDLVLRARYRRQ